MNIFVDIDETIADFEVGEDTTNYYKARPIDINIEKINKLYDEGHKITYWTARSSVTVNKREEYTKLTIDQLNQWGCKYHDVQVGNKPPYDMLICDKSRRIEEL
jgi:hypothetical protein